MKWLQKKSLPFLISLLLILSVILTGIQTKSESGAETKKLTPQEKAVMWLREQAGEGEKWDDDGLANLTCDAMAVLRMEGTEIQSSYLDRWQSEHEDKNNDELAHLVWGQKEVSYLDELWKAQNDDGGFGLTKNFTSENYDTFLALQAAASVRTGLSGTVKKAAAYLLDRQNTDGGFGFVAEDSSEPGFSAQTGIVLKMLGWEDERDISRLDTYCQNAFNNKFEKDTFYEQAGLARYLYQRNQISEPEKTEEALYAIQSEDGSVYEDVEDTIQYILLLREIEEYHRLKFQISGFLTKADTYVLESGREQTISLDTSVDYSVNQALEGQIRYTVFDEDKEIFQNEEAVCFIPDQTQMEATSFVTLIPEAGKQYVLRSEIVSKDEGGPETIWESREISLTVHHSEREELKLEAKTTEETGCGIRLNWNDISNKDEHYGYRLFRQKEGGQWETRSVWDGEEKVRVLNIYPHMQARNYLTDWMSKTVSQSGEPAGKGLFEIDRVFLAEYNYYPEKYLFDENGEYRYDVLMFGTYDANAYSDLTEKSYEETKKYIESGRGVLFGHDTITANVQVNHPVFSRFEEQMGIRLIRDGYMNPCTRVKVVNSGFLTSYPWKLSGMLTVPATHSLGQYTGGDAKAEVWMEFESSCLTDATGACNNAYLFTNKNLAMIQTGHSSGQATDDERKVIANTLFYLKQLTNQTEASDKSFYDEASPEKPVIAEAEPEDAGSSAVRLSAEDRGTSYEYYVEAVNSADPETEPKRSNTVTKTAISGVRGYIVGISDSEEPVDGLTARDEAGNFISEIVVAEGSSAVYDLENMEGIHYLHVYAVDYAGNISEETVQKVEGKTDRKESAYFNPAYTLFAGAGELEMNCCQAEISGSVYGRDALRFQGSVLNLAGRAVSADKISLAGWKLNIVQKEEGADVHVMPDYMDAILSDLQAEGQAVKYVHAYDSMEVLVPVLCKSTTGAYCQDVHMAASLVSEGNVSLNANTVRCGVEAPVVLCSRTGDITVQATKLSGSGLIYAPKGTVTINVSELDYQGSIIAEKIKIQAGYIDLKRKGA